MQASVHVHCLFGECMNDTTSCSLSIKLALPSNHWPRPHAQLRLLSIDDWWPRDRYRRTSGHVTRDVTTWLIRPPQWRHDVTTDHAHFFNDSVLFCETWSHFRCGQLIQPSCKWSYAYSNIFVFIHRGLSTLLHDELHWLDVPESMRVDLSPRLGGGHTCVLPNRG